MDTTEFGSMVSHDERHWWYRGRRLIVRNEIDRLLLPPRARLLDAGCGSGRTLDELARYGSAHGIDTSSWAVAAARDRGHADVLQASVEAIPYPDMSFDLVTCLDVIEHTPDDGRALEELLRVTLPGGHLLVTVPAFQALWSPHDEVNQHYRRYRAGGLRRAALENGWEVERDTYFNSLLFPAAALMRLVRKVVPFGGKRSELSFTPPWLDRTLMAPLRLEAALLARGRRLPAGLSLLMILRRPELRVNAGEWPMSIPDAAEAHTSEPVSGR